MKKYLLYSGSLAIETVLLNEYNGKKAKIVIPANTCHRVLTAILRANCIPIFIQPQNGLVLTKEDVGFLIANKIDFDCVILVFQYGLFVDVEEIRKIIPNKVIIEDISQTIMYDKCGNCSDYVVGSFNKTKPLSVGVGGFIATNKQVDILDYENMQSRYSENVLLPYTLQNIDIDFNKLQTKAKKNINKKFKIIDSIISAFDLLNIKCFVDNYERNTYNRLPVICKTEQEMDNLEASLKNCKIPYEKPHIKNLSELSIAKNYKDNFYNLNNGDNFIFLKLNNVKKWEVKKWLKELKK